MTPIRNALKTGPPRSKGYRSRSGHRGVYELQFPSIRTFTVMVSPPKSRLKTQLTPFHGPPPRDIQKFVQA
jgi:hypothetical protein